MIRLDETNKIIRSVKNRKLSVATVNLVFILRIVAS
nr:MAG TPA: hypothetical protein [Caudoviricetes sp.]